jgi:hypothetical protein
MRRIEFSPEVLDEIERDRFQHLDPAVQRRMEVLWLKANGEKHQRIAELAGLSRPTVQRLLDMFLSGGLIADNSNVSDMSGGSRLLLIRGIRVIRGWLSGRRTSGPYATTRRVRFWWRRGGVWRGGRACLRDNRSRPAFRAVFHTRDVV